MTFRMCGSDLCHLCRFVHKCCPGVSMEEWNAFLSMLEPEEEVEEEEEDEDEEDDHDKFNNRYTVPTKNSQDSKKNRKQKVKS